ncbi:hypothetical protein P5F12_13715 [Clostridium perfringens]|nr:hypothetical protein [Clostridium perfringens]
MSFEKVESVFNEVVDNYFIRNYGCYYENNGFGQGKCLECCLLKKSDGHYLWIVMTRRIIYFYEEHSCGGYVYDDRQSFDVDFDSKSNEEIIEIIEEKINDYFK